MRPIFVILLATLLFAAPPFTPQERQWLRDHPEPFKVAITQIPNQVLETKKGYVGFSIDLFRHLEKIIDHPFRFVYYPTWHDALAAAKAKQVDILFLAQKTPSRLAYFDFTDTVLVQRNHIIHHIGSSIDSLKKVKKLALVKGSAIEEYIRTTHPQITIVQMPNELASLLCVFTHNCDATISEPVRASAYIRQTGIDDLIVGPDIGYDYYLSIATIKEKPQLNVILTKAYQALNPKELEALKIKWGYLETKLDLRTLLITLFIATLFMILSLYLFFLNRRLKRALETIRSLQIQREELIAQTISTISHHWRQPLNTLSMLVDLVKLRYEQQKLDAPFIEYFHTKAKNFIQRLSRSLELFRSFELAESPTSFELLTLTRELIDAYASKHPNITFHLHASGQIPLTGYPHNVKKLLSIVIQNSIEAIGEQKGTIDLSIQEDGEQITITIQDSGKGVEASIAPKIFEPYFSTKEEKNDVGLGLYIAKLIVTNYLKGSIELTKNKPATFTITFPKESA